MDDTVVIITGAAPSPDVLASLPDGATLVAADSGLDDALAAGLSPTLVVGDLDSVSTEGARWAHVNATVHEHPAAKARTDTELAIELAAARTPRRLVLVGGPDGTRLDHTLAAVGALGSPVTAGIELVEAHWAAAYVRIVHEGRTAALEMPTGAVFSVLALHGTATGVTVSGGRWTLDDVELPALSGLGVSNEAASPPVIVGVTAGVLTVIVPPGAHRR